MDDFFDSIKNSRIYKFLKEGYTQNRDKIH